MRASEFLIEDNPDYDEDRFLKSDPGTPLSFPKGTTLVNVSDVYDWYKLGMAVSDLDDADPREFNRGVPHTVFAFGSEEEEHKMIPLLKRLGFSLHDIDSPEDYQKAIRASDVMEHLEEMARNRDSVTEAPRDVFHFVGHSPAVPRPTGNYYKWQVDLSNGQHYYIRAGAYTKLEKFQQYFTRKWGAEMPDVEVVDATRLERLSEGDLEEMAGSIHGGVRQVLDKKGYRYLGGGIDKQAFLEPGTGQVLVIFGYSKWAKGGSDFSVDQRMFVDWAKYCQQHSNNPHLPRFSGWESFDFQGKRYLQIRMEPLQELSDYLKMIIVDLEEVAKYSKSNPKTAYKKIANFANYNLLDAGEIGDLDHKAVVKHLGGEQAAYNLLKTVYDVKKFGKQHGFEIDLHGGNYMQRADGTIIVNDPFVVTFF